MDTIARPFGLLLMFLYNITHNYLFAIVLFTILVKVILLPFQMKSKKGMMRQQMLQPQIQELQKKHQANPQKLNMEMQRVYREAGVSPMSGCLWTLLPFPILIALYQAVRKPLTVMMGVADSAITKGGAIYEKLVELQFDVASLNSNQISAAKFINDHFAEFKALNVKNLQSIDFTVLGLDLSKTPSFRFWEFDWSAASKWWPAVGLFLIPVFAAFFMWLSTKVSAHLQKGLPGANIEQIEKTNNSFMMLLLGPIMSLWFAFILPAAMGIYWTVNSLVSMIVDIALTKYYAKTMLADFAEKEAQRKAREAELEAKRIEAEKRRAENAGTQAENTSKRKQQQKKKQESAQRALDWQRANNPEEDEYQPSRVGTRRYARGRSYDPDRYSYNGVEGAVSNTSELDENLTEIEDRLQAAASADTAGTSVPAEAEDASDKE